MPRTYKCYYCKKYIDNPEDQTEFYMGKQKKRSHKSCRNKHLKRQKRREENKEGFYRLQELLLKVFKIKYLTPIMQNNLHSLYKRGIDYSVIYVAAKISEDAMYKHLDKPWNYHFAIIQNNIINAQDKIKKYKAKKKIQKEYQQIKNNDNDIVIKNKKSNNKIKTPKFNIADI